MPEFSAAAETYRKRDALTVRVALMYISAYC